MLVLLPGTLEKNYKIFCCKFIHNITASHRLAKIDQQGS